MSGTEPRKRPVTEAAHPDEARKPERPIESAEPVQARAERVDASQVQLPAQSVELPGLVEAAPDAADSAPTSSPEQRIDVALIEEALRGRLEAFNELVRRHQDQLYSLVYRLVPDPDQAADAVQEAFFSAYRNLAGYRGGSVKSWLGRIAVNAAMDMQRSRRRRPFQPYPEFEDDSWQPPAGEQAEPETQ